ncbi:MAG TPA: hypothetical protein VG942_15445 [Hyphomonadaceae bacterium]|nr:hypothetical protein [Hyphomonadaceae bacterium]
MRYGLMACAGALALTTGACGVLGQPHNDVLIFGTTTKVALDVSAPVQNGALPEFTLGYKRNEGVWMPLKPNGSVVGKTEADLDKIVQRLDDCTKDLVSKNVEAATAATTCANFTLPGGKYVSYASGVDKEHGGANAEVDTYSVFASFGGRGGLGFNAANGSLAQFFATGIAAQRLGANPGLTAALKAEDPAAATAAAKAATAQAEADKAKAEAEAAAAKELAPSKKAKDDEIAALTAEWKDCGDPDTDRNNFLKAVSAAAETRPAVETLRPQSNKSDALAAAKSLQAADIAAFRTKLQDTCKGT